MTVYNVLIVDDEPYIVHCIADLLNEHPFEEASLEIYTAFHAKEALQVFEKIRIDILISDIEMPEMSGMDLVKQILVRFPLCKCIFLTAYPKYEYAVTALEIGIVRYLLKTDDDGSVIDAVSLAIHQLEESLSRLPTDNSNKPLFLQDEYMSRIVQDPPTLPSVEISKALLTAGFREDLGFHMIAICPSDKDNSHQKYRLHMLMNHYIISAFDAYTMMEKGNVFYWLLQKHRDEADEHWLRGTLETLLLSYEHITGATLRIVFCYGISNQSKLPAVYSQIKNTISILEPSCVFAYTQQSDKSHSIPNLPESPRELIQRMRMSLEQHNHTLFVGLLRGTKPFFIGNPQENCPNQYALYNAIIELLLEYSPETDLSQTEMYPLLVCPHLYSDWQDAYVMLREVTSMLFPRCEDETYLSDHLMRQIMKYVQAHNTEIITLNDLSEETGYNASYLSHFFAVHYGEPFSKYIAEVRIEHIKKLMCVENLSLNEIARKTGFESRSYFNRFVNRMTNQSPMDLRKMLLVTDGEASVDKQNE